VITLGAKILSILLGTGAAATCVAAGWAFLTMGPESGAIGVVLVDSLFGTFILFTASRFLWIYAVKRDSQRTLADESDQV
jgi:hypothetical protein